MTETNDHGSDKKKIHVNPFVLSKKGKCWTMLFFILSSLFFGWMFVMPAIEGDSANLIYYLLPHAVFLGGIVTVWFSGTVLLEDPYLDD